MALWVWPSLLGTGEEEQDRDADGMGRSPLTGILGPFAEEVENGAEWIETGAEGAVGAGTGGSEGGFLPAVMCILMSSVTICRRKSSKSRSIRGTAAFISGAGGGMV